MSRLSLLDSTGRAVGRTTTNENGQYFFGGLPAGTYTVNVVATTLPNGGTGLTNTVDPDGGTANQSVVTLAAGGINLAQDFGYRPVSPQAINNLSGTLWNDTDADGTSTAAKPAVTRMSPLVSTPTPMATESSMAAMPWSGPQPPIATATTASTTCPTAPTLSMSSTRTMSSMACGNPTAPALGLTTTARSIPTKSPSPAARPIPPLTSVTTTSPLPWATTSGRTSTPTASRMLASRRSLAPKSPSPSPTLAALARPLSPPSLMPTATTSSPTCSSTRISTAPPPMVQPSQPSASRLPHSRLRPHQAECHHRKPRLR